MSELPELPPAPRRTGPLPSGGLEAAVREGRRRRHRAMAGAAVAVLGVALVVPSLGLLPDRGGDRLDVVDAPDPTPPPTTPPAEPPTSLSPAAFREDTDTSAPGGDGCAPDRTGGDALCRYAGGTAPGSTLEPGEQATAVLGYCLPRDAAGAYVFSFRGGQEKDVVVTPADGGEELFRFSTTVRYVDGAHERRLRPGQCLAWTGRWQLTASDGSPVPPGDYVLSMTVRADQEQAAGTPVTEPLLPETVEIPLRVAG